MCHVYLSRSFSTMCWALNVQYLTFCRACDFQRDDYLLGYNAVYSDESELAFRRKLLAPKRQLTFN
jgi:hypothetical protein